MNSNTEKVILKIDSKNAFNSVERDVILGQVLEKCLSLYSFFLQCYEKSSILSFGEEMISSEVGSQQGDPAGPMLFCVSVHPIL